MSKFNAKAVQTKHFSLKDFNEMDDFYGKEIVVSSRDRVDMFKRMFNTFRLGAMELPRNYVILKG